MSSKTSLQAEIAALREANDGLRTKVLQVEQTLCESMSRFQAQLADREQALAECRRALAAYAANEAAQVRLRLEGMSKRPVPTPG